MIQIHITGVRRDGRNEPVSGNLRGIRIVISEQRILHANGPDILLALHRLPSGQRLRSGNNRLQRLYRAINNSLRLRPGMLRIYIFPINAGCDQDLVARHGNVCRRLNGLKRMLLAARPRPSCIDVNVILHTDVLSYLYESALDCSDCDAFYKIFLCKRINDHNRKNSHNRQCHSHRG